MPALTDPVQKVVKTVRSGGRATGAAYFEDLAPTWSTLYGVGGPIGEASPFDPAPTGGIYVLVSKGDTPVEWISSIGGKTWDAIEAEYRSSGLRTELSETFAAVVRGWTTGGSVAALVCDSSWTKTRMPFVAYSPAVGVHALDETPAQQADDPYEAVPDVPETEGPEAYRAFRDLAGWLSVSNDQVADMLGIGRTTPYTWRRDGREPRPENARRLYEYHAVLDSLRRSLGSSEFQMWLRAGHPSRRDRLLAGELESLDRDVHAVVFRRAAGGRADLGWAPEPVVEPLPTDSPVPTPRRAGRRPRRARLT